MKRPSAFRKTLVLLFLIMSWVTRAHALLGQMPEEVEVWAKQNSWDWNGLKVGHEGCLKEKRYVEIKKDKVTLLGVFLHPIYSEPTAVVSQLILQFNPPVNVLQAQQYAAQLIPSLKGKKPTHTQSIPANPQDPCLGPKGGKEARFSGDYILEYFPSQEKISLLRLYNDFIR